MAQDKTVLNKAPYVVIPNWNGKDSISATLESLKTQTMPCNIVVVDNGSIDGSVEYIEANFPEVIVIKHAKNLGFAGGVNAGIRYAIDKNAEFVALLNNDAVADKSWLTSLYKAITEHGSIGIVAGKILSSDGKTYDSAGEEYTTWGIHYPRGRGESAKTNAYEKNEDIFLASGGASLYKTDMFKQIGLFDEDFFAYYEDVDLSLRTQLAGWKIVYEPKAVAYHQRGATSSKIKGFTTYQTVKNLPWIIHKNIPLTFYPKIIPRFFIAHFAFMLSGLSRGHILPVLKGFIVAVLLMPKKFLQRIHIQKNKRVSNEYIWSRLVHDLPPEASRLRRLRAKYRRIVGKHG